ncbi:hypothetical protein A9G42_08720 [Gilliamella sp. Nev6-6]|uniref:WavE lipopolysaccharide synthesis family protein n=1 Tax=Gilliamella sp. Nev6-6 TaxID=3120252 RepID=UPI00080F4325|nr:WavE lipopolysaccharide synthesis family protein [Gilliamella apicola]OCG75944.1 hypothetical protein A9G42_08720 [Gilliamella apicola]
MHNISLLIHGPYNDNILNKISYSMKKSRCDINEIIFVIYENDKELYEKEITNLFSSFNVKKVFVKDLINPGFANINRQLLSVQAGLNVIDNDRFVIKLRNDQYIDFNKFFRKIKKYNWVLDNNKIITTCCYTRKDRLYHPSDMFLAGMTEILKEYYALPLYDKTELNVIMEVRELVENNDYQLKYNPFSPESELFRNFLIKRNWDIKETKEDSYNAFCKYIYLLNSWDISLRWKKKRNYPFKKKNQIVLPHFFKLAPFVGGPVENASCILRHEIHGRKNIIDCYYIVKSKVIWKFWPYNQDNINYIPKKFILKIRYKSLKLLCIVISILPYFVVSKIEKELREKIRSIKHKITLLRRIK